MPTRPSPLRHSAQPSAILRHFRQGHDERPTSRHRQRNEATPRQIQVALPSQPRQGSGHWQVPLFAVADHTYHQKPRGRRRTRSLQGRTQQRHLRPKNRGTPSRLVRKKVPRQPRRNHHAARLLDILLNREPDATYHMRDVDALSTDMRRAEALGMTWSDVSVENRSILIEQQFAADRRFARRKARKACGGSR